MFKYLFFTTMIASTYANKIHIVRLDSFGQSWDSDLLFNCGTEPIRVGHQSHEMSSNPYKTMYIMDDVDVALCPIVVGSIKEQDRCDGWGSFQSFYDNSQNSTNKEQLFYVCTQDDVTNCPLTSTTIGHAADIVISGSDDSTWECDTSSPSLYFQGLLDIGIGEHKTQGRAVHLAVVDDIDDLSVYSIAVYKTDGSVIITPLPNDAVVKGENLIITHDSIALEQYFGKRCWVKFSVLEYDVNGDSNDVYQLRYNNVPVEQYNLHSSQSHLWDFKGTWTARKNPPVFNKWWRNEHKQVNIHDWDVQPADCASSCSLCKCNYPTCYGFTTADDELTGFEIDACFEDITLQMFVACTPTITNNCGCDDCETINFQPREHDLCDGALAKVTWRHRDNIYEVTKQEYASCEFGIDTFNTANQVHSFEQKGQIRVLSNLGAQEGQVRYFASSSNCHLSRFKTLCIPKHEVTFSVLMPDATNKPPQLFHESNNGGLYGVVMEKFAGTMYKATVNVRDSISAGRDEHYIFANHDGNVESDIRGNSMDGCTDKYSGYFERSISVTADTAVPMVKFGACEQYTPPITADIQCLCRYYNPDVSCAEIKQLFANNCGEPEEGQCLPVNDYCDGLWETHFSQDCSTC